MLETGKRRSLKYTIQRWAGLVSCALYLIVASNAIYAFPTETVSAAIEVGEQDECADMVCAVQVNDEGKSTCCCNPDGEESAPASILCVLKDCPSPQDGEGTADSQTTKPVPQSTDAASSLVPALPGIQGHSQTTLRPPHADIPDKIPI